jgi:TRAP-type uncharacterized transport system substrate-binding protein
MGQNLSKAGSVLVHVYAWTLAHAIFAIVFVRSRVQKVSPLYWRGQYRNLAAKFRAERLRDQLETNKLVRHYEARLTKESVNRETAVRCYETLLADRERQLEAMAANLRLAKQSISDMHAMTLSSAHPSADPLPVHPTLEEASKALHEGKIDWSDFVQLDLSN